MTRFWTLDALRGVAAIMVMIGHTPTHPLAVPDYALAVDLFFALSGFVMVHSYGQRLADGLGTGRFMALRIARLGPMILLGGFIGYLVEGDGARAMLLIPQFHADGFFPANPPFWSLLLEMIAYVVFSTVLYRLTGRGMIALTATCAAVLVYYVGTVGIDLAEVGGDADTFALGLVRLLFSFSAGILVYRWVRQREPSLRTTPLAWLSLGVALAALATHWPGDDLVKVTLVIPALVWVGARFDVGESRWARALADVSYPLYCLHWPLLIVWAVFGPPMVWAWPSLTALALLVERYYDRSVRSWATNIVRTWKGLAQQRRVAAN